MICVDQLDTAARERRLACWQHSLDRLEPRVEPPPRGGRCSLGGRPPWESGQIVPAARLWHSPWERDAMVWHVCWTTAPGATACPMRVAALGPLTAPVWWAARPNAMAIIFRQSQACSGLIQRAAFVMSTRLARALSPLTRGTPATRSAVGAGSWLCHTSAVCRVTSSARAPPGISAAVRAWAVSAQRSAGRA